MCTVISYKPVKKDELTKDEWLIVEKKSQELEKEWEKVLEKELGEDKISSMLGEVKRKEEETEKLRKELSLYKSLIDEKNLDGIFREWLNEKSGKEMVT